MPGPSRKNRDQDIPTKTGEEMGPPEPIGPRPPSGPERNAPLPEEETYERDRDRRSDRETSVERE
jgi:hypothetical protein